MKSTSDLQHEPDLQLCCSYDSGQSMQVLTSGLKTKMTLTSSQAAGSNNTYAPLPGVRENSRSVMQHEAEVQGLHLMTVQRPFLASVSNSKWRDGLSKKEFFPSAY